MNEENNFESKEGRMQERAVVIRPLWESLVDITDFAPGIEQYGSTNEEKSQLLAMAYQTLDLKIFETILDLLPEEKHELFLDKFAQPTGQGVPLDYLKKEIEGIEDIITTAGGRIKEEILKELQEL